MNFETYRAKLAKFIVFGNLLLFVLLLVLYAINGFTTEELNELLKYMIPIKALYLTAVIKFILAQQKDPATVKLSKTRLQPLFKSTVKLFVYLHLVIVSSTILLTAFNMLSFDFLVTTMLVTETFFGIYNGLIITDLYAVTEKEAR